MDHFEKIAARLESRDLDTMLLTNEANRFYASGFRTAGTDGMALVTRDGCCYYMTDSGTRRPRSGTSGGPSSRRLAPAGAMPRC